MTEIRTLPIQRPRRGIALPLVLICLVLIGAMGVVVLRTVLLQHRHLQTVQQRDQAIWLAESALQRAAHRVRMSSDYRGEVWNISAETMQGTGGAEVKIEVAPQEDEAQGWQVAVEAVYSAGAARGVSERRELWIPASDSK